MSNKKINIKDIEKQIIIQMRKILSEQDDIEDMPANEAPTGMSPRFADAVSQYLEELGNISSKTAMIFSPNERNESVHDYRRAIESLPEVVESMRKALISFNNLAKSIGISTDEQPLVQGEPHNIKYDEAYISDPDGDEPFPAADPVQDFITRQAEIQESRDISKELKFRRGVHPIAKNRSIFS